MNIGLTHTVSAMWNCSQRQCYSRIHFSLTYETTNSLLSNVISSTNLHIYVTQNCQEWYLITRVGENGSKQRSILHIWIVFSVLVWLLLLLPFDTDIFCWKQQAKVKSNRDWRLYLKFYCEKEHLRKNWLNTYKPQCIVLRM